MEIDCVRVAGEVSERELRGIYCKRCLNYIVWVYEGHCNKAPIHFHLVGVSIVQCPSVKCLHLAAACKLQCNANCGNCKWQQCSC